MQTTTTTSEEKKETKWLDIPDTKADFRHGKKLMNLGKWPNPAVCAKGLSLGFYVYENDIEIRISNPLDAEEAWEYVGPLPCEIPDLFDCLNNKTSSKLQFAASDQVKSSTDKTDVPTDENDVYDRSTLQLVISKKGLKRVEEMSIPFTRLSARKSVVAFQELKDLMAKRDSNSSKGVDFLKFLMSD